MFINKKVLKIKFLLILFFLLLSPFLVLAHQDKAEENHKAVIYYNIACGSCKTYLEKTPEPILTDRGYKDIVWKDYVNKKENRKELNGLSEKWGIPAELKSHIMIFVDEKVVLAGHVPENIIKDLLKVENQNRFDKILVFQDKMGEGAISYKIWGFKGEVKEYDIKTPVSEYLDWFEENKDNLGEQDITKKSLLPIVLSSGFLDGLNPCAFAVLLFFVAFLFTIRRTRGNVLKMGLVYILAVYLVYFLIGLGLLKAIEISGVPHFMAKVASWLIIILGLINILNVYWPRFPIKLQIPKFTKPALQNWIHKTTLPAAFIAGILVGLCTFPCSGGIYVVIVGLLSVQTTYLLGLGYLLLYNAMFVLPLAIILLATSNKSASRKLGNWEKSQRKAVHLILGFSMIILGVVILIWFV